MEMDADGRVMSEQKGKDKMLALVLLFLQQYKKNNNNIKQ